MWYALEKTKPAGTDPISFGRMVRQPVRFTAGRVDAEPSRLYCYTIAVIAMVVWSREHG